jgi:hypothetical protein
MVNVIQRRIRAMTPVLTFEEMQQHYPNEWLLIAYTEIDENLKVIQGEVLAHSPHAEEVYRALPHHKDRAVALEYIGEIPNDLVIML